MADIPLPSGATLEPLELPKGATLKPVAQDELTWEKVKAGASNVLPSALLGAAKPFYGLNQAAWQLAGKVMPSVANMGDYPVEMLNKRQAQLNAEAGPVVSKFTTEPASLIGENVLPMQAMNKVGTAIGAIPSFTKALGANALTGAALGYATPEKTGLTPEQFAQEKAKTVASNAALNIVPDVLTGGGKMLGSLLRKGAGISTGAGEEALKQAYKSGQIGDETFLENMRQEVSNSDVLTQAKQALANMRANRSAEYKTGIETTKKSPIFYKFEPIEEKLNDELKTLTVKNLGKELPLVGDAEMSKVGELKDIIGQWKKSPELWTAEGLDALKRRLDAIYPEKLPQAARIIQGVRNKVYNHIVELDPNYAKTMKAYEESINLEREIEKALSLGKKASADTAIRKLQSLTRNNANANYGYRQELAQALKEEGGKDLMPALSGQALSSWTPRGIVGQGADVGAILATLANPASALSFAPMAAYTSPRLMGETAYKAGQIATKAPKMTDEQKQLARLLILRSAQGKENE